MDNTETTKPQQTGGLKLMTVFIAVLALHVLVIGGFTVYHLMGSGGDTDVALDKTHLLKADGTSVAEVAAPDTTPAEKPADAPAPVDNATPASAPAATTTATLTNVPAQPTPSAPVTITSNPTPAPAPTPTPNANAPLTITAPQIAQIAQDAQTVTEASSLAPPPEPVPAELAPTSAPAPVPIKPATATASTPKVNPTSVATTAAEAASTAVPSAEAAPSANTETPGTLALGPVHMPAANAKPVNAPTEEHVAAREHDAKHEFYTVKITDSYKKIARAHHITVAELKAANHIHDNVLHTGQKLIIPLEKSAVVKDDATPETGTASHVVLNESTSTASLSAEPTPVTTEHHARHHLYTVEKGDTLKKIAQKFNTTTLALKEANNLHGTKLVAGEKLKIPTKEARSAAVNPPAPLTPVPTPAQPNQVETQPTPIAPVAAPAAAPAPEPQSTPPSSPELANLTF